MSGMGKIKIYHNKSCSKSREALKAIMQSGKEFEVVNYLEEIPSVAELQSMVVKLNVKPIDIIRKTEKIYLEKFKGKDLTDEEWINAMHQNPILIQRPIVVDGDIAVVARSEEELDKII